MTLVLCYWLEVKARHGSILEKKRKLCSSAHPSECSFTFPHIYLEVFYDSIHALFHVAGHGRLSGAGVD